MDFEPPKLSFTTMGTPGRSLDQIVSLAQAHGFSGVDLRCSPHLGEIHPQASDGELREISARLREAKLEVPSLLCYPEATAGGARQAAELAKELQRLLVTGRALGACGIRIFGPPMNEGEDIPLLQRFRSTLVQVLADSAPEIQLFIQNHKGGSSVKDCVRLVQQVDDARLKIVYSPDHGYAHDATPIEEQWGLVAPHTGLIYLSDLRRHGDGFVPTLPGRGEVPLSRTLDRMFGLGFAGYCSFKWEKIWHPELPEFEVALPHFFALTGISRERPK